MFIRRYYTFLRYVRHVSGHPVYFFLFINFLLLFITFNVFLHTQIGFRNQYGVLYFMVQSDLHVGEGDFLQNLCDVCIGDLCGDCHSINARTLSPSLSICRPDCRELVIHSNYRLPMVKTKTACRVYTNLSSPIACDCGLSNCIKLMFPE